MPPPPPVYGQGGPGGPPAGTNVLAIISLVVSIIGFCCLIGGIVGVVLGYLATNQIKQTGQQGAGLAKAGIIVGIIAIVVNIIWIVVSFSTGSGFYYYN